ncbi:hypothetical protein MMC07_003669 [Pseudocyphellaria aurata]|nr:hypothetical protein [Pseudocyphellaria aurata]
MADPLSIAASIVALLDLTKEVVKFGYSFYKAKEGREKDIIKLKSLDVLVKVVTTRLDEARRQPTFPWHTVILDALDPKRNGNSPLTRANEVAAALKNDLRPEQKIRKRDRFLRYGKKNDIETQLDEISGYLSQISIVLDRGHYELSKQHFELSEDQHRIQNEQYTLQKDQHTVLLSHDNLQKDHMSISKVMNERVENMQGQFYALNDTVSRQEEERKQRRLKKEDESLRKAIEQWLSPLEFLARQRDLISKSFQTGLWLLESEEFTSWVKGRPWQLRCFGDTGSGKTYLASMVIDHMQKTYQTERSPVLCMYLSEKESENHTPENLLGSILKQLLQLKRSKPVIPELRDLYQNRTLGAKPTLQEMEKILDAELAGSDRIYLIIDALNECSPKSRHLVEHKLPKLYSKNLSLMVTSTEYNGRSAAIICDNCRRSDLRVYFHCGICKDGEFDLCEKCVEKGMTCQDPSHTILEPSRVEVEVRATDDEIRGYVRAMIDGELRQEDSEGFRDPRVHPNKLGTSRLAKKLAKDQSLLEKIPAAVIEGAKGKFLLAKLYMDSLVAMRTLKEIKDTLNSFPDSWNEYYEKRMKERVDGQKDEKDRALALKILSLVTSARRPLTLTELQHALAIEPGDHEFDPDRDFDRELILEVTKGLLTIDDGDDANSYVRFFHLTLQKYLDESRDHWFPHAEFDMATACLTCLLYNDFAQRSEQEEDLEATLEDNPFAGYALQLWGEHVGNTLSVSSIEDLTFEFLEDRDRLAAFIQAAWYSGGQNFSSWDVRRDVDAMHVCAWFGLSSLILKLGLENYDIDVPEQTYGQTPLFYACKRGHVEAARQLLELGADVNAVSEKGKTPLFEAIEANQREMVDLLLRRSELCINVGNSRNHDRTALIIATQLDLDEMITAILKREDIDVNVDDADGYAALSLAAAKGSDKIVEALLTKPQINVNSVDVAGGRSALMLVAEGNQAKGCEIIRVLMEHGANPNLRGHHRGRTALSAAVEKGHIQVVETLLEFNQTDFFCKDDDGRGLLHDASKSGHADIIRLLKAKNLDLNLQDINGFTPLHEAVLAEHPAAAQIVELLLDLGADPNIPDKDGNTPFAHISWHGQSDVANVFKERLNMGYTEETTVERIPIWTLVKLGHIDLIAEEIAAGKANLNEKEPGTGNGPLHIAVLRGRDDILQVLLDEGKMEINTVGQYDCTPLHLAAMHGHEDSLDVLMKRHANLDPLDHLGFTPLSRADKDGDFDVALTLIEAGATFDPKAINLQALIFRAAGQGRTAAMKIFLDRNIVDPIQRNEEGLTVRQIARRSGDVDMIRLLDPAKSFVYKSPALSSKESSISSLPSMPSPPSTFTPFRAFPVDLSEQEDAELEEPLENKFSRLASQDGI